MELPVRINLSPQNADLDHDYLMAMSDPSSPDFGTHWTPEQVHDFYAPSKEAVSAVQDWLALSGIPSHKHGIPWNRGHVQFEAGVMRWNRCLQQITMFGNISRLGLLASPATSTICPKASNITSISSDQRSVSATLVLQSAGNKNETSNSDL